MGTLQYIQIYCDPDYKDSQKQPLVLGNPNITARFCSPLMEPQEIGVFDCREAVLDRATCLMPGVIL